MIAAGAQVRADSLVRPVVRYGYDAGRFEKDVRAKTPDTTVYRHPEITHMIVAATLALGKAREVRLGPTQFFGDSGVVHFDLPNSLMVTVRLDKTKAGWVARPKVDSVVVFRVY